MKTLLMKTVLGSAFGAGFMISINSNAHPVFFADGVGLMMWQKPDSTEFYGAYTFSHKMALGLRYFGFRDKSQSPDFAQNQYTLLQSSFLLKRWNRPGSQANIYLSLGYGAHQKNSTTSAYMGEVQADWEDREYYTALKYLHLYSNQDLQTKLTTRLGFAPYIADFTELNTWVIVESSQDFKSKDSYDVTPFVRLFYKNFLTEFGYSLKGKFQFNFMTHL